ncbi:MAG: hypothetical protein LUC99_11365 [Clostridiales bacterium]|nr:hypothetical protein [Clostridiales bacterium]
MRDINVNIYGDINLIPNFDDFVVSEDEFSDEDEEMFEEVEEVAEEGENEEDATDELSVFCYAFLKVCEACGLIKIDGSKIMWNVKEGR